MSSVKDALHNDELCRVCNAPSFFWGEGKILLKYHISYFRCSKCGFIQSETPYWLTEAYSSAIASLDAGIMQRNLLNCEITSAVLNVLFPNFSRGVDYGAGHGILVRMMRDRGFNFHWFDLHASNDYARGFEYKPQTKYDLLTAFEVFEHLEDPIDAIGTLMKLSDNLLVSTCLVPPTINAVADWWYFLPQTGQHISFYTVEALRILGMRFGRHVLSMGDYHLFSKKPCSRLRYSMATNPKCAWMLNKLYNRTSLTQSDFNQLGNLDASQKVDANNL